MLRRPHSLLVRGSKAYFGIGGFPITPQPYYRRVRSLARWPRGRSEPYNPATEMRDGPLRAIRIRAEGAAEEEAVRSEDRSAARPRAVEDDQPQDALRRSVETERAGGERRKPAARDHRATKIAGRSSAQAKTKQAECVL